MENINDESLIFYMHYAMWHSKLKKQRLQQNYFNAITKRSFPEKTNKIIFELTTAVCSEYCVNTLTTSLHNLTITNIKKHQSTCNCMSNSTVKTMHMKQMKTKVNYTDLNCTHLNKGVILLKGYITESILWNQIIYRN